MDLVLLTCALPEGEFAVINVPFFFRTFFPYGSVCRFELQMIKALLCLPEVHLRFCGESCRVEKEFILILCFLLT